MSFSPFLFQLYLQCLSQLQLSLQPQPSWPLSGHASGSTPLTLGPTNSTPRIHHHLLPVSCLGQGSQFQELLQLVPCQAGRVWAGSEAWEYPRDGRGSQHLAMLPIGTLFFHPRDASLWLSGCSFQTTGYPLAAAKSLKAGCQAASIFVHFGKYSRIP